MSRRAGGLLAVALLSGPAWAQQRAIDTTTYRQELGRIRAALDAADLEGAKTRAAALRGVVVADGSLRYESDGSLLGPLRRAADARAASALRPRLEALIRSLDQPPPAAAPAADHDLLESLRRAESPEALEKGGQVGLGPLRALTLRDSVVQMLDSVARAIDEQLRRFWRFLNKLGPKRSAKAGGGLDARPATVLIVIVAAATLLLLAVRVWRRRGEASRFIAESTALDAEMARRWKAAAAKGARLRYVATIDDGCAASLREVPADSALGRLSGPENIFVFRTERYAQNPLVVSGPGAGPQVTAAGAFADVIRVARSIVGTA